jgi:hypothetical protein
MYKKGVWGEVLRILNVECWGLEKKRWIIRRIVNYCHSGKGLRYDSYITKSHFGLVSSGGTFNLKSYLERAYPFCNCFDQAAALQTLLGAIGIDVEWVFMSPFGYLHETSLVGRGRCNNPVFYYPSPCENSLIFIPELVPRNLAGRRGFGCHAFCIWKRGIFDVVLDACVGPHIGDEIRKTFISGFKQAYIDASIDGLTNLYSGNNFLEDPGGLDDMDRSYKGVIDVVAIPYSPFDETFTLSQCEKRRAEEFMHRIDFDKAGRQILRDEREKGVVYHWKAPFDCTLQGKDSQQRRFEEIRIGINVTVKEWCLIGANEFVKVEVYVANKMELGSNGLILLALSTTLPRVPFEIKQDKPLGHFHIYHRGTPYYKVEKWMYYNVCVEIVAYNTSMDVDSLVNNIQEQVEPHVKDNLEEYLPAIKSVLFFPSKETSPGKPFPCRIGVGERVTIRVEAEPNPYLEQKNLLLEFFLNGENLRLLKESMTPNNTNPGKNRTFELTFEGRSPGITEIKFVLANKNTLLCSHPFAAVINVTQKKQSTESTGEEE